MSGKKSKSKSKRLPSINVLGFAGDLKKVGQAIWEFLKKLPGIIWNFLRNLPAKLKLFFTKTLPNFIKFKISGARGDNGYISFKRENKKKSAKPVAGPLSLIKQTFGFLKSNWRVLSPIIAVYAGLYLLIVRVNINFDQKTTVDATQEIFKATGTPILTRITSLGSVVASYRPSGSEQATVMSSVLIIIFSVIYIWAIRSLSMGKNIRSRDALYSGTTNLIPFVMVMAIFAIQLLPLTLATVAYNMGDNGLVFIYWYERTAALVTLGLVAVLTLYFSSNSLMALYACTIPGVYPIPVMRSTRNLVRFQRARILLNLIVGMVIMFFFYLCLLLLITTYLPKFTPWMLDIFNIMSLPIFHTYLYKMYRSMI